LTIDSRIALVDHLGPRLWNVEAGVEPEIVAVKEQAIINPGKAYWTSSASFLEADSGCSGEDRPCPGEIVQCVQSGVFTCRPLHPATHGGDCL